MQRHAHTHSRRRFRRVALSLAASLFGTVLLAGPSEAVENSSIQIAHTPPSSLVAGDAAVLTATVTRTCGTLDTCGENHLGVTYLAPDGSYQSVIVKGTKAAQETLSVAVPGDHVRFPDLNYRLAAWFEATGVELVGGPSRSSAATEPRYIVAWHTPETDPPTTIDVNHQIRLRLVKPDGTPGSGVLVMAVPLARAANQNIWTAETNANGWVGIAVPRDDPWIAERVQAGDLEASVWVSAFDNPPTAEIPAGQTEERVGLAADTAFDLNLGDPDAPARHWGQNTTLDLVEEPSLFLSGDSCTGSAILGSCSSYDTLPDRRVVIGKNIGAGEDVKSAQFGFQIVKKWKSTIGVQVGGSSGPWKSEGRVTAEEGANYELSATTSPIPENLNYGARMTFDFEQTTVTTCYLFWCREKYILKPYEFKHIAVADPAVGVDLHDMGREVPTSKLCDKEDAFWLVSGGNYRTSASETKTTKYSVSLGGDLSGQQATLHFSLGFTGEASTELGNYYEWRFPLHDPFGALPEGEGTRYHHYLYIPDGHTITGRETLMEAVNRAYTHRSLNPLLEFNRPDFGTCGDVG